VLGVRLVANLLRVAYFLAAGLRRLRWSKQKLTAYQDKRVRAVVRHAYDCVHFYHEKLKDAGVLPGVVRCVSDLGKLPVVRKDELRSLDVSRLVSREYGAKSLKVLRTSGSTGKPFRFYVSGAEDDWRKALYLRANVSCGQRPRDVWAFVTSPRHFGDTTGLQRRLGFFAQTLVPVFARPEDQVRIIRETEPDVLDGYSGALFLIGHEVERQGISDIRPRLMFGSADSIDVASRKYLEKVFKAPYLDQYGCSEVDRTAWQCPEREGYHMDVDSVVTQFVDENGADVAVGENGEIVLTSLFNYAMPFIRYALGDVGRASGEACSCGRILPLMEGIEGRQDSFLVFPDGRVVSPRVLTVAMSMFEYYDRIRQFRIVQKRDDLFEVSVKIADSFSYEPDMARALGAHLVKMLKVENLDVKFNVKVVEEIPLSKSGKLMAVVSEVKANL
jgi:phenylacetate-CoA ligase